MSGVTSNLLGRSADDTMTVERSGKVFRQHGAPVATLGHIGNWAVDVDTAPYGLWSKVRPWPEGVAFPITPNGVINTDPTSVALGPPVPNAWARVALMPPLPSPVAYSLKWYGDARFPNTLGDVGDFGLFTGSEATPTVWGPKAASGWPENGDGPTLFPPDAITNYTPRGLAGDGPDAPLDTTDLTTSSVTGTAGIVSTVTVTTTTNQQVPFWLRGVLADVGAVLGADFTAIAERGLETWGQAFPGTLSPAT